MMTEEEQHPAPPGMSPCVFHLNFIPPIWCHSTVLKLNQVYQVLFDFDAEDEHELHVKVGDKVRITGMFFFVSLLAGS